MIDSHCHLFFDNIKKNLTSIIDNAKNNNITSILSINTDPFEFTNHYELIKDIKGIYISYGLHPEKITNENLITKELIISNLSKDKVIGIGETGLDFYHSIKFKKQQFKIFEAHIEASIESKLPLIIHQRNSEIEIMEVLKKYQKSNNLKVVFHCFTGSDALKKFCIENNYYISLSGIVTFKNAIDLRDVIKDIPLSLLLIETDSPFLSPTPYRGKMNQPANVKIIGEYLSQLYEMSINKFENITDNNFYNLFSKAIRYNKIY